VTVVVRCSSLAVAPMWPGPTCKTHCAHLVAEKG
jgi:hypothetical protein